MKKFANPTVSNLHLDIIDASDWVSPYRYKVTQLSSNVARTQYNKTKIPNMVLVVENTHLLPVGEAP